MSKENKHIDDIFKQLNGSELPLDGSEWARLEKELQPKKKKRGLWFWLLGIAIIASGSLLGLYLTGNLNFGTKGVSAKNNTVVQIEPDKKADQLPINERSEVFTEETASTEDYNNQSLKLKRTKAKTQNPKDALNLDDNPSQNTAPSEGVLATKPEFIFGLRRITKVAFNWSAEQNLKSISLTNPYLKPDKPIEPLSPMLVGLSYNGLLNNQLLSAQDENYLNYRNGNENPAFGQQINIELIWLVKQMEFGTGVAYMQQNQALESPNIIAYQIYDSIPVFDNMGNLVDHLRFNYRDTAGGEMVTRPQYRSIGIPLSFGYNKSLGPKLALHSSIGITPSLLVSSTGTVVGTNIKPEQIDIVELQKLNINGNLSLGLRYEFKPRWMIEVESVGQIGLNNMSTQSDISQRFANYGLNLGLFYSIK